MGVARFLQGFNGGWRLKIFAYSTHESGWFFAEDSLCMFFNPVSE